MCKYLLTTFIHSYTLCISIYIYIYIYMYYQISRASGFKAFQPEKKKCYTFRCVEFS